MSSKKQMAGKRVIEYLTNAVERQIEEKKLLDKTEKVWSVSHAELQKMLGEGGKKKLKNLAKTLSSSNRIQTSMPTLRRQLKVPFTVSTHDPTSRYVKLGDFNYAKAVADMLVEGVYSEGVQYEREVVLHGYKVDQGFSDIPGINTTIKWNVDELVKEIIRTLGNQVKFMQRTLELKPYGDLQEYPRDTQNPMQFITQNVEFDYPNPTLVPLPENIFNHRKAKCMAAINEESLWNGVVPLELPSPVDGQPTRYVVMHCTHVLPLYLMANASELELHFSMLPLKAGAKRKQDDRALFLMLEQRFRATVPVILSRFVGKAPTFDPSRMCFAVGKLHDPVNFDKMFFKPDEPEQVYHSYWKISLEFSLVPSRSLGHSLLWADTYIIDGTDNTEVLERYLKGREFMRISERSAQDLKNEAGAEPESETAAASSDAMEVDYEEF